MKRCLVSAIIASTIATSSAFAGESGGFLGFQLGTGAGFNRPDGGQVITTNAVLGLRGGYQKYVTERSAVRAYLSGMTTLNANYNASAKGINLGVLADVDVDYMYDFVTDQNYSFGMYVGAFTGALIGLPILPKGGNKSYGIAAGINLGLRTTVNSNNEFDFGVKLAGAFNSNSGGTLDGIGGSVTKSSSIGAFVFIGAGYSYKF